MCVITTEKYVEQMDGQSNFVSIVQCYTEFLQYMIENSEMESESIHDLEKTIEMVVQGGNDELQQFLFGRFLLNQLKICLLYTSPSPRDGLLSRMPSSA